MSGILRPILEKTRRYLAIVILNGILVVFGTSVAVLASELVLRIWTPSSLTDKRVRQSDPILNHSLTPSSSFISKTDEWEVEVKTNSDGFRDHEWPKPGADAFTIAVLGDSFVEGMGVDLDSSFTKRLERGLNHENRDRKVAVLNCGVVSYSPLIEYLQLTTRILQYRPNLVIQCFDMSDIRDDYLYTMISEFDSRSRPVRVWPVMPVEFQNRSHAWWSIKSFIQSHSYLYPLVGNALLDLAKNDPAILQNNIHSGGGAHMMDSTLRYWEPFFKKSQQYISLTSDTLRSLGIPYLLCIYPYGCQVSPREWKEGRSRAGIGPGVYNSAIFRSMKEFAMAKGLHYLDMTPAFKRCSDGTLYFAEDPHWTSRGHKVAADTLQIFLKQHGLLSDR